MGVFLENMSGKMGAREGCQTLCGLKSVKYVLMLLCIILLSLSQHLSSSESDIAAGPPKNSSNTNNDKGFLYAKGHDLERDLTLENLQHPVMNRVKRSPNQTMTDPKIRVSSIRLPELLIMYPCCATIIIILGMEVFGQGLRDPLNKFKNLILILLCVILSLVMFSMSLLIALRTVETTMIIISILSFLFLVLELADFITLLIS